MIQLSTSRRCSPFRAFLRKRFSNRSSSIKLLPSQSWKRSSFDHFVGAGEQRRRDSEAERYARKNSPSQSTYAIRCFFSFFTRWL
jgi:hypothetical protein